MGETPLTIIMVDTGEMPFVKLTLLTPFVNEDDGAGGSILILFDGGSTGRRGIGGISSSSLSVKSTICGGPRFRGD